MLSVLPVVESKSQSARTFVFESAASSETCRSQRAARTNGMSYPLVSSNMALREISIPPFIDGTLTIVAMNQ
jgi:hypothetical protein